MSRMEEFLSRYFVLFIMTFFAGGVLLLIGLLPLVPGGALAVAGSTLMGISIIAALVGVFIAGRLGEGRSVRQTRGMPVRTPARVEYKFRTDDGKHLDGEEEAEGVERWHVVLLTKARRKLETETAREVYDACPEGMWGWAWLQGDWMGRFDPDPELQRQMEP
jgi:hypothetical protein